jgi:hypothetical protein
MNENRRETPWVGVHVLGGADLAVRGPLGEQLDALAHAPRPERLQMLAATRAEVYHAQPPLGTLLAAGEAGVDHAVVVATQQAEMPHRGDTARLADVLQALSSAEQQQVYGRSFTCEALTVGSLSLHAARQAVREHFAAAPADQRPQRVVVGPSGATTLHVGVALGLLEAGVRPRIAVRTDTGEIITEDLAAVTDEPTWLVRLGLFAELAELAEGAGRGELDPRLQPPLAADWRLVDALQRLDWPAAGAALVRASPAAREIAWLPAELCDEEPPQAGETWRWLRLQLQSAWCRRAAAGEAESLLLAHPWIEARAAEVVLDQPTGSAESLRTPPGRYAQAALADTDPSLVHALEQPEFQRVHQLLFDEAQPLWDATRRVAAGHPPAAHEPTGATVTSMRQALRHAGAGQLHDDLASQLVERLGTPPWPLLADDEVVVVHAVGEQNLAGDASQHPDQRPSPMLDGLAKALPARGVGLASCHLRLVATPQTEDDAGVLAERAEQAGFASAHVIGGVPVVGYEAIQHTVRDQLAAEVAKHAEIVALVGPGSRELNFGLVAAAVQAAFNAVRRVSVGALQHHPPTNTTRLDWRRDDSQPRVVARLAHDSTLVAVLPALMSRLNVTAMQRLLRLGSPLWDDVAAAVAQFAVLAFGDRSSLAGAADELTARFEVSAAQLRPDAWWAARARLVCEAADADVWWAVVRLNWISAAAWPTAWPADVTASIGGTACQQLRYWRTHSPFGAHPWGCPPTPTRLAETVAAATDELHADGQLPTDQLDPDRLVGLWHDLQHRLQQAADLAKQR